MAVEFITLVGLLIYVSSCVLCFGAGLYLGLWMRTHE